MIDNKEIEFDPPETPNVITAPMPKYDKGISATDDVIYVAFVSELVTPLPIIKKNLLQDGLFPRCIENVTTKQPNLMDASCCSTPNRKSYNYDLEGFVC